MLFELRVEDLGLRVQKGAEENTLLRADTPHAIGEWVATVCSLRGRTGSKSCKSLV